MTHKIELSSYKLNQSVPFFHIKVILNVLSGIYEEPRCNPNNLSHAVLLVGYGSERGRDYWIIKNRSEHALTLSVLKIFVITNFRIKLRKL